MSPSITVPRYRLHCTTYSAHCHHEKPINLTYCHLLVVFAADCLLEVEMFVCHPLKTASVSTLALNAGTLCSKGSATVLAATKVTFKVIKV